MSVQNMDTVEWKSDLFSQANSLASCLANAMLIKKVPVALYNMTYPAGCRMSSKWLSWLGRGDWGAVAQLVELATFDV